MTDPSAPRPRGLVLALSTVLATGFGSGYAPIAPGTAGSLVGLLLFWPMARLSLAWQLLVTAIVFFLGVAGTSAMAGDHTARFPWP